jgi:hypothetical protein
VVAALDSVQVIHTLPPTLAAGSYDLRATADTLGVVVETNETNNGHTQHLNVIHPGTLAVGDLPLSITLSTPFPNPTSGGGLGLELPRTMPVRFSVHDLRGRTVWKSRTAARGWSPTLRWNSRNPDGSPVAPGSTWRR